MSKFRGLALVLAVMYVTCTFADTSAQPIIELKLNQPAPYDGILFTNEAANKVRYQLLELDRMTRLNGLYEKDILVLEKQSNHWKQATLDLSSRVIEADSRNFWQNAAYFGLGAVTVILLAFATSQAINYGNK